MVSILKCLIILDTVCSRVRLTFDLNRIQNQYQRSNLNIIQRQRINRGSISVRQRHPGCSLRISPRGVIVTIARLSSKRNLTFPPNLTECWIIPTPFTMSSLSHAVCLLSGQFVDRRWIRNVILSTFLILNTYRSSDLIVMSLQWVGVSTVSYCCPLSWLLMSPQSVVVSIFGCCCLRSFVVSTVSCSCFHSRLLCPQLFVVSAVNNC